MLQTLSIRNIALIDQLDIDFENGFHVLTGETGAGKSIIIDAVNFVLGERANRDILSHGAQKAFVQAVFSVKPDENAHLLRRVLDLGIDLGIDSSLIISRELSATGKSVSRINSTIVTLGAVKTITDLLVDIHGQHEHQSLLKPELHIAFLDHFGGSELLLQKKELEEIYYKLAKTIKRLRIDFPNEQERARRMDILSFQINEIKAAKLSLGEEEDLLEEHKKLNHAQQILSALENAYSCLTNDERSALLLVNEARRQLEGISALDSDYYASFEKLNEAYYALEDISYILREQKSSFEFQPSRLEAIEERLDVLHTLKRKYGHTVSEILAFYDRALSEYTLLEQSDDAREKLQGEKNKLLREYHKAALLLTETRQKASDALSSQIVMQLRDLGMEKAAFKVSLTKQEKLSAEGMDAVEFLLSTNAGEPLKPLHRVASGGELSRIMLAFKTIYIGDIHTVVFDEIDAGISGHTGIVVGEKMRQVSRTHQVLCITHLPQIAAQADVHFHVSKSEQSGRTVSTVRRLSYDERICELAHIMGASCEDATAMEHARTLLEKSSKMNHE